MVIKYSILNGIITMMTWRQGRARELELEPEPQGAACFWTFGAGAAPTKNTGAGAAN